MERPARPIHVAVFDDHPDHAVLIEDALRSRLENVQVHLGRSAMAYRIDAVVVATNTRPDSTIAFVERIRSSKTRVFIVQNGEEGWSLEDRSRLEPTAILSKHEGGEFLRDLVGWIGAPHDPPRRARDREPERGRSAFGDVSLAPAVQDVCAALVRDLEQSIGRLSRDAAPRALQAGNEDHARALLRRLHSILGLHEEPSVTRVQLSKWTELRVRAWRAQFPWVQFEMGGPNAGSWVDLPVRSLGYCLNRWVDSLAQDTSSIHLEIEEVRSAVPRDGVRLTFSLTRSFPSRAQLIELTSAVAASVGGQFSIDESGRVGIFFPRSCRMRTIHRHGGRNVLFVGLDLPEVRGSHELHRFGWRTFGVDLEQLDLLRSAGCRYRLALVNGELDPEPRDVAIRNLLDVQPTLGVVLAITRSRLRAPASALDAGAWGCLDIPIGPHDVVDLVRRLVGLGEPVVRGGARIPRRRAR